MRTICNTLVCAAVLLGLAAAARAGSGPMVVNWSANDLKGEVVKVPAEGKVTVLAFVRADQPQSLEAIKEIKSAIGEPKGLQVVLIVNGQQASEQGKGMQGSCPWPIVIDPAYAASGQMNVHVWPTTLVIQPDGTQIAHLAGLSKSFANDLSAYAAFAGKRIDESTLKQRLAGGEVVADSPKQMAGRHLKVAQRLLERGSVDPARAEVNEGLALQPDNADLKLMLARIHLLQKQPREAIGVLDSVPAGAVPGWQVSLLRGKALVQQENWDQAKSILPDAMKLNPDPAEAHYLLGLVHEHEKDYAKAAAEFRAAYEANLSAVRMK